MLEFWLVVNLKVTLSLDVFPTVHKRVTIAWEWFWVEVPSPLAIPAEKALSANPNDYEVIKDLGNSYQIKGRWI